MASEAAAPLRVGLLPRAGRFGLHLIERFADGGPFRVVAAVNPATVGGDSLPLVNLAAALDVRLVSTPQELFQAEDIDVLWITSDDGLQQDFAASGFAHGKHTIAETPLGVTAAMTDKAFAESAQRDRLFLVHHPRRADLDYRQAQIVANDRSMGAIRAVKFVSWSYAIPPSRLSRNPLVSGSETGNASDPSGDPQRTKLRFVAHALDQLVGLIGDRPLSVLAMSDPQALGAADLLSGYSLALRIVFEKGCQAEIDIRLDSPTSFQSGWLLTGEHGGYANGRRLTLTDEGEVFDSPVATADNDAEADQFEWLAQQIRSGVRNATEEARVRTVAALMDAARQSLNQGGGVCVVV
ncbi:MAG: Gfo/Idh/MocA family protein [Planctomycetaceae bacterium]